MAGIVTGAARYTLDLPPESLPGLLHLKLARSPHAHARILSIDTSAALAVPGVEAVFTHVDAPLQRFSSAQHELHTDDPADTRVLVSTAPESSAKDADAAVGAVTGAILGAKLGSEALPEFYLESLEQAPILSELACDMAQGKQFMRIFDDDWDQKYNQGMPINQYE